MSVCSDLAKPTQLTSQYVRMIHNNQGSYRGVFQIIEFHGKKKAYSTHISDGYFKCKVIFKEKPSKQIERGQIKLFSILYGVISNHGSRIFLVIDQLKAWDYPRTVGMIKAWKYQSPNLYINGNHILRWHDETNDSSQKPQDIDNDSNYTSLTLDSKCFSQIDHSHCKAVQKSAIFSNRKELKKRSSSNFDEIISNLCENIFSFGTSTIEPQKNDVEKEQLSNIELTQSIQKVNVPSKAKTQNKNYGIGNLNQKKLNLSFTQSQDQSSQKKAQKVLTNHKKVPFQEIPQRFSQVVSKEESIDVSAVQKSIRMNRSERIEQNSLKKERRQKSQVLFGFESQSQQEDLHSFLGAIGKLRQNRIQKLIQESTTQIINSAKSNGKKQIINKNEQISCNDSQKGKNEEEGTRESFKSKSKSFFEMLFEQDESVEQNNIAEENQKQSLKQVSEDHRPNKSLKFTDSFLHEILNSNNEDEVQQSEETQMEILKKSSQKIQFLFSPENQIGLNDLRTTKIHCDEKNVCRNWLRVKVLCMKYLQENNSTKILVVMQQYLGQSQCGHIFNVLLSNAQDYNPFDEGDIYQMSLTNVSVAEPNIEQMFVEVELRASSQDIKARKIVQNQDQKQAFSQRSEHFCYIPIERVESLRQGVSLNIVGIVSAYRNFANKKKGSGWTNIFTIVDPMTGASTDFTIFDAHKLTHDPGSPAVILNALTNIYNGKKSLISRNYTFFYFGKETVYEKFINCIPQLQGIKKWIEDGNSMSSVIGKKNNFNQIPSLIIAESLTKCENINTDLLNVQTGTCRIMRVSPFYFRLICDKCNKKVNENNSMCFDCGKRQNPLKQLQLSLQISDSTHSLYVQFNHYDSVYLIGQEGQKITEFISYIIHKRAKFWLILNPKYKATVAKMEVQEYGKIVAQKLSELKKFTSLI